MDNGYVASKTMRDFHNSDKFVRGIMGPIGSGKSVACIMEMMLRSLQQTPFNGIRKTRWAVIRNTYRELLDTTMESFFDWFPKELGLYSAMNSKFTMELNLPDGTKANIEFLFRALDRPNDIKKLLSLELTGIWLNEAREIPLAVLEMGQGRVGRYPSKRDGGPSWFGLIADTNPPDSDHWWYNLYEEGCPDNHELFKQPSGKSKEAENTANLPASYYDNMVQGKTKEWVNVYVNGLYGFISDGKPVYPEYNDDIHAIDDDLPRAGNGTIYIGIDFGLCYDDITEVLTNRGWLLFKDVNVKSDKVATRNPATGEMTWTDINFKKVEPYKGKLIGWSSQNVNFLVTPEHRVPYTTYGRPADVLFTSAQDLRDNHPNGKRCVDVTSHWVGEQMPLLPFAHADYATFMGWWMSDGSLSTDGRICLSQSKRDNCEVIEQLLGRMGVVYSTTISKTIGLDNYQYRFRDEWLESHLLAVGRLKLDRVIPAILLDATPEYIRLFVEAYTLGDGHIRYKDGGIAPEWSIYFPTKVVASQMQELAQKLGYTSVLKVQRGQMSTFSDGRVVQSKDGYVVRIKTSFSRATLCGKNQIEQEYDGYVYCLNVPYHTLYIRREGIPSWNGNTPAASFGQITASGQFQIIDELVTFDMGAVNFGKLLKERINHDYCGCQLEIFADPAGEQRAQTDEITPFQILWNQGIEAWPTYTNDPLIRREAVADYLQRLDFGGKPAFVIGPKAIMARKAFAGGYKYKRLQVGGEAKFVDKPDKNKYSHISDAIQYMFLGAVGGDRVVGGYGKKEIDYDHASAGII